MNDVTAAERYRALAEAYGGTLARWPSAERAAAACWAATPEGTRVLAEAAALDRHLDLWPVSVAAEGLATRIVAHAPAPPLHVRVRWWWSTAGIAAALAGAVAGTAGATLIGPSHDLTMEGGTVFGEFGPVDDRS